MRSQEMLWGDDRVLVLMPDSAQEYRQALQRIQSEPTAIAVKASDYDWLEHIVCSEVVAIFSSPWATGELEAAQGANTTYVSPSLAAPLLAAWRVSLQQAAIRNSLTERECDILDLLLQEMSNIEIASALFLSRHTVRNHLSRIFAKLDVMSREEARASWRAVRLPAVTVKAKSD